MIEGTPIEPGELTQALLTLAGAARERLTLVSPVVEPGVLEALREVLRPDVEVVVVSDSSSHVRLAAADEHLAILLSTTLTSVGTGIGWIAPTEAVATLP